MRTRYSITEKNGIYFVTSTTVEWIPLFTSRKYCDIVIQSLRFCKETKGLRLYAFVIMDNHIHLIAKASELSGTMASFKKFTAKEIIGQLKHDNKQWLLGQLAFYKKKYKTESDYQVWQEGIHPQLILNEEMLMQKIEYIYCVPKQSLGTSQGLKTQRRLLAVRRICLSGALLILRSVPI